MNSLVSDSKQPTSCVRQNRCTTEELQLGEAGAQRFTTEKSSSAVHYKPQPLHIDGRLHQIAVSSGFLEYCTEEKDSLPLHCFAAETMPWFCSTSH